MSCKKFLFCYPWLTKYKMWLSFANSVSCDLTKDFCAGIDVYESLINNLRSLIKKPYKKS